MLSEVLVFWFFFSESALEGTRSPKRVLRGLCVTSVSGPSWMEVVQNAALLCIFLWGYN